MEPGFIECNISSLEDRVAEIEKLLFAEKAIPEKLFQEEKNLNVLFSFIVEPYKYVVYTLVKHKNK